MVDLKTEHLVSDALRAWSSATSERGGGDGDLSSRRLDCYRAIRASRIIDLGPTAECTFVIVPWYAI